MGYPADSVAAETRRQRVVSAPVGSRRDMASMQARERAGVERPSENEGRVGTPRIRGGEGAKHPVGIDGRPAAPGESLARMMLLLRERRHRRLARVAIISQASQQHSLVRRKAEAAGGRAQWI